MHHASNTVHRTGTVVLAPRPARHAPTGTAPPDRPAADALAGGSWTRSALFWSLWDARRAEPVAQDGVRRKIRSPLPSAVAT